MASVLGSLDIPPDRHVLIAGPTASGKSGVALEIAERDGGVIVNADALQVYGCWRVLTARPSVAEEARAAHALYGHVAHDADYSVGHWLREVETLLAGPERLIVTGGTGLYFAALTEGLGAVPETPPEVRARADAMDLDALRSGLDARSLAALDDRNRARVQRAWEVLEATGRPLIDWQADPATPLLPLSGTVPICLMPDRDALRARIAARFDAMLAAGALEEARANLSIFDPSRPAFRAIGAPELTAHLRGEITLDTARDRAVIASRQYAKRQRTWFRSRMADWTWVDPLTH